MKPTTDRQTAAHKAWETRRRRAHFAELADLSERAIRCPGWVYRPGMAILPLEGATEAEPIRIVQVDADRIWLFVPAVAAQTGPDSGIVSIPASESPNVDLSDAQTFAAANQGAGVFPYGLDTIRDLVESLETDLPF